MEITGRYLCTFITGGTTAWTAAVASIYSLVAIANEAYHAAFHPFKRRVASSINLRRSVFLIWLVALLWGLPLYLSVTYVDDLKACAEEWPHPILPKIYSFGWIIVAGVIPISVMSVLYFKVSRLIGNIAPVNRSCFMVMARTLLKFSLFFYFTIVRRNRPKLPKQRHILLRRRNND